MKKNNVKTLHNRDIRRSSDIYRLISSIRDLDKRNILRGYSSKGRINNQDVEVIRKGNSSHDSAIIGALLKGRYGLRDELPKRAKRTSNDLCVITGFSSLGWKNEVSYTAGYINSVSDTAIEILHAFRKLVHLESVDSSLALDLLLDLSKNYGASNYLSYKLAYIRSARDLSPQLLGVVSKIESEMEHRKNAGMHFSALENLSSKVSLFGVAQRRISGVAGRVNGEFRKAISLSNFIPTPLDCEDVPGFLLRATESSLVDTAYAILVLFNLDETFADVKKEFELRLKPELLQKLFEILAFSSMIKDGEVITEHYISHNVASERSLNLYRISTAFLERPAFAKYRNRLDRVIGARLLAEVIGDRGAADSDPFNDKNVLLGKTPPEQKDLAPAVLDTFYRTFLFLKFIRNKSNILSLTNDEVKFVFENTVGLDILLSEAEIRTLYLTASDETKSLIAVLALALFRHKSIDPDVDFEFRADFISYVKLKHGGSILNFINSLLEDSPQIANYMVVSLDEVTLEKMYSLVKNASEASRIRGDILRAVGQRFNRIEYIIEADAIITRSKLSKLQQYFDSSRMYVDSVAMKKWLDSNPTISTEQYRSLYSKIEARIASIKDAQGGEKDLLVIQINDQEEYLISQIVKDAFEQFCLNTEFGIQSYLGRRIRHNTLDGVTIDTVDAVLRKPEYDVLRSSANTRRIVSAWLDAYRAIIDKLRRDQLQFKSSGTLFNANLDLEDASTKENIRKLSNTLSSAGGGEMLNELVIAFCWKQITPQLENAARHIRTTLLNEAYASIEKYFSGINGSVESQIKSELHQAVNEVFKKVADWFQVPETGFVSASPRELCQIILNELSRSNDIAYSGNAIDNKYTGISVHRMYDCLAVLLKNAQNHGKHGSKIFVHVTATRGASSALLDYVSVEITSTAAEENFACAKNRILDAINSEAAGSDMVTEGYTGIKKIKVITRACEGNSTVRFVPDDHDKELKLGFSLHVEISQEVAASGAAP